MLQRLLKKHLAYLDLTEPFAVVDSGRVLPIGASALDKETLLSSDGERGYVIIKPAIRVITWDRGGAEGLLLVVDSGRMAEPSPHNGENAVGWLNIDRTRAWSLIQDMHETGIDPYVNAVVIEILLSGGSITVRTREEIKKGQTVRFSGEARNWVESGDPSANCAYGVALADSIMTRLTVNIELRGTLDLPMPNRG